jgi:catalase (peroxidase I)
VFSVRLGFTDEETVALIGGGHAIGKAHLENSGFLGPWSTSPVVFTNQFFTLLKQDSLYNFIAYDNTTTREGQLEAHDLFVEAEPLMMLPTDLALVRDPVFARTVDKFASDELGFFEVFASAFGRLLELGVPALEDTW